MPILEEITPFVDKIWVYGLSILDASEVNWKNIDLLLKQEYPTDYPEIRNVIFDKPHEYWTDLKTKLIDAHSREDCVLSVHW